jgi:hypothetical protein
MGRSLYPAANDDEARLDRPVAGSKERLEFLSRF